MAKKEIKKNKKDSKIVEPDYTMFLDCGAVIDIYEHSDDNITCKITLYNAFVIFGKIVKYNEGVFIAYPSYYSKKKKQYVNQAYCFDKDINEEITDMLNDIYK